MPKVAPPNHSFRFDGMLKLRRIMEENLDPRDLVASCVTCTNFDNHEELCNLGQPKPLRPPARIIAFGCPSYNDVSDEIPF